MRLVDLIPYNISSLNKYCNSQIIMQLSILHSYFSLHSCKQNEIDSCLLRRVKTATNYTTPKLNKLVLVSDRHPRRFLSLTHFLFDLPVQIERGVRFFCPPERIKFHSRIASAIYDKCLMSCKFESGFCNIRG